MSEKKDWIGDIDIQQGKAKSLKKLLYVSCNISVGIQPADL